MARAFVEHMSARPAAYDLMFQGTVPGFRPSQASHAVALTVLQELLDRLAAAGIVTKPADIALIRSLMSGIAAEQIVHDPEGRMFLDQTERGVRAAIASIRSNANGVRRSPRRAQARQSQSELRPHPAVPARVSASAPNPSTRPVPTAPRRF